MCIWLDHLNHIRKKSGNRPVRKQRNSESIRGRKGNEKKIFNGERCCHESEKYTMV